MLWAGYSLGHSWIWKGGKSKANKVATTSCQRCPMSWEPSAAGPGQQPRWALSLSGAGARARLSLSSAGPVAGLGRTQKAV